MTKIVCCSVVKNCGRYLEKIFKNLDNLQKNINTKEFICVFVYDNCTDNSESLLINFKKQSKYKVNVCKIENKSPFRTVRIAKARNKCLDIIYNQIKNVDYHIMFDSDNVNSKLWNTTIIHNYLNDDSKWDAISFNKKNYYDIWALLYNDYKHHFWGFGRNSRKVINFIKKDISNLLNNSNTDIIDCISAFNGLTIYKTQKFKGIAYDGFYKNVKLYINDKERLISLNLLRNKLKDNTINIVENIKPHRMIYPEEQCEHINYHLAAIKNNSVQIKISKYCI